MKRAHLEFTDSLDTSLYFTLDLGLFLECLITLSMDLGDGFLHFIHGIAEVDRESKKFKRRDRDNIVKNGVSKWGSLLFMLKIDTHKVYMWMA